MTGDGRGRSDPASAVAGATAIVLAVLLGLDRGDVIDLGWSVVAPLACAALGAVLLASGLGRPR